VAAGAPLQVWVSGDDLFGVESLKLTAQSSGLVLNKPKPEQVTFTKYTPMTGSKVFVLDIPPYAGEARTIELTATMTHSFGRTTTVQRTVKVGGFERDLVFEIQPPDPQPMQTVTVVVRAVNAPPGTKVTYTVEGTDGYRQNGTLDVREDGTIRFEVPGSGLGVEDVLDARIDGSTVRRTASYRF
jgi:hypothetical protein